MKLHTQVKEDHEVTMCIRTCVAKVAATCAACSKRECTMFVRVSGSRASSIILIKHCRARLFNVSRDCVTTGHEEPWHKKPCKLICCGARAVRSCYSILPTLHTIGDVFLMVTDMCKETINLIKYAKIGAPMLHI